MLNIVSDIYLVGVHQRLCQYDLRLNRGGWWPIGPASGSSYPLLITHHRPSSQFSLLGKHAKAQHQIPLSSKTQLQIGGTLKLCLYRYR